MRLSMMAWIRRVAPVPVGPVACVIGSIPAKPLLAAAAICPSALVARAIAVAAWSACDAATAFSPALGGDAWACEAAGAAARAAAIQSGGRSHAGWAGAGADA